MKEEEKKSNLDDINFSNTTNYINIQQPGQSILGVSPIASTIPNPTYITWDDTPKYNSAYNKEPDTMYKIGEEVYHICPESPKGYVLDIKYSYKTKSITYLVTFGINNDVICEEEELLRTKSF